jgi:hypothetical protein
MHPLLEQYVVPWMFSQGYNPLLDAEFDNIVHLVLAIDLTNLVKGSEPYRLFDFSFIVEEDTQSISVMTRLLRLPPDQLPTFSEEVSKRQSAGLVRFLIHGNDLLVSIPVIITEPEHAQEDMDTYFQTLVNTISEDYSEIVSITYG